MPTSLFNDMERVSNGAGAGASLEEQRALQLAFELSMLGLEGSSGCPGTGTGNGTTNDPDPLQTTPAVFEEARSKKSQNMTECVPVPSSEHVAEIVGRQGKCRAVTLLFFRFFLPLFSSRPATPRRQHRLFLFIGRDSPIDRREPSRATRRGAARRGETRASELSGRARKQPRSSRLAVDSRPAKRQGRGGGEMGGKARPRPCRRDASSVGDFAESRSVATPTRFSFPRFFLSSPPSLSLSLSLSLSFCLGRFRIYTSRLAESRAPV